LRLYNSSIRLHEAASLGDLKPMAVLYFDGMGVLSPRRLVERSGTSKPDGQGQDRKSPFTRWKKNSLAQPTHS
jgi:hypothetical protein